jgi:glycosyltransferase involved in cell wall biosynthesis
MNRISAHLCPRERSGTAWLRSRSAGACPPGAVLVHAPSFAFQAPGGGENQLVQTGIHVEALGHRVRPFCPWTDRIDGARLLHLFGMSREGLELARRARALGTPVLISPIAWFEPSALWSLEEGTMRKAAGLAAWAARRLAPGLPGWRRDLLHLADRILPNSEAEARQLVGLFGANPDKIRVIPNGVLESFRAASPDAFRKRFGVDDFVLFVGRIEPRKNPLGLIRALRQLNGALAIPVPPRPFPPLRRWRWGGGLGPMSDTGSPRGLRSDTDRDTEASLPPPPTPPSQGGEMDWEEGLSDGSAGASPSRGASPRRAGPPSLVIIGDATPEARGYLELCRREGGDDVLWVPALDHHDPLLASAYAAARVFALPSWFETPGLSALEAALAGTPIVITPFGSTREYFGDRALYARPGKLGEIAEAVARQWSQGRDPRLASLVASHYLWPRVAQETAEVYDQVAA